MTQMLLPSWRVVEERLPKLYRSYAGIGPYYLPVFGRMYRKRLRQCLEAVRRHADGPRMMLDAGCGLGIATAALADMYPQASVWGLDVYPDEILAHAEKILPGAARAHFVSGSIQDMPFEDHSFDVVTVLDVLEHVPQPEAALDEIVRVLKPVTGVVVASVPIESPLLGALRYVALAGGRRGDVHPHWEGTLGGLCAFEQAWLKRFDGIEVFNAPLRNAPRAVNYDVVFVGSPRSGR